MLDGSVAPAGRRQPSSVNLTPLGSAAEALDTPNASTRAHVAHSTTRARRTDPACRDVLVSGRVLGFIREDLRLARCEGVAPARIHFERTPGVGAPEGEKPAGGLRG